MRSFAQAAAAGSKGKGSAKDSLVGGKREAGESGPEASTSKRAPFGEESDDDEDDVFEDARQDEMEDDDDDELMIAAPNGVPSASTSDKKGKAADVGETSATAMSIDPSSKPSFAPLSKAAAQSARDATDTTRGQLRKIPIPPHRMTPLKNEWPKIYTPLVEMAGLQVRMNVKRRTVEIKSSKHTGDVGMLQKGADFVKAFALGFDADDALALLRIDDLFVDSFEIKDVKTLHGDHLSRAIGRIAGKDGRTRFAIENASRTRLVVAETKIHILGSFANIKIARDAVVALIMGSPPGKVYANLKTIGARQRQRG
ncbi:hypothetical protein FA10DRAFT_240424 [Acaromyces ingoldii]|uniref:Pre-rRNA-processing protein PNO1 n=1 Tax=Acaromyces ingoldii TaxID=215250 RepID=A0A316YKH0_9BASI|nr:hypothetical protein FA10DRAFT_240424 [Acaromyces ingoldii]PWN89927.1 hypothetical protein FA10DRAFT_240424 [Acaromyces ingoldii]